MSWELLAGFSGATMSCLNPLTSSLYYRDSHRLSITSWQRSNMDSPSLEVAAHNINNNLYADMGPSLASSEISLNVTYVR